MPLRHRTLTLLLTGLITLATAAARAEEPRPTAGSARPMTPDTDDGGPRIPVLAETDSAKPKGNPWVDAGLARRRDSSSASPGDAAHRPEARPVSASFLGGYASEGLKLGFGLRAGYSFFERLYVGGAFMFHLGTSVGDASVRFSYPSAELGYDAHVGPVTIRPYAGLGLTVVHASLGDVSATEQYVTVYPGLHVDLDLPDTAGFVGLDGRMLVFAEDTGAPKSIGVFLTGGARF
ncbi:MAG: hypothetical protein KF850_40415 [Labilithrix sp.]|nr:hypothetical protein [Labilithrix sp.]MBX3218340.1 hypothetical protein [Labilithrix sp.]